MVALNIDLTFADNPEGAVYVHDRKAREILGLLAGLTRSQYEDFINGRQLWALPGSRDEARFDRIRAALEALLFT